MHGDLTEQSLDRSAVLGIALGVVDGDVRLQLLEAIDDVVEGELAAIAFQRRIERRVGGNHAVAVAELVRREAPAQPRQRAELEQRMLGQAMMDEERPRVVAIAEFGVLEQQPGRHRPTCPRDQLSDLPRRHELPQHPAPL